MPITLGANIAALITQRKLAENADALSRTFERLSSGLRINRASDDAASLAIANSLTSQSRVYGSALRNISDGISALQIADQAIGSLSEIANRISELATQAANGVYSSTQRQVLDREAQALHAEYTRIIASTEFNDINLLDGSANLLLQVGLDGSAASQIDATIGNVSVRTVGLGTFGAGSFSATTTQRVQKIATADFNRDGIADVVSTSDTGAGTQVWIGNGDGAFQAGLPLGVGGSFLTVGDFNNDGQADVLFEGAGSALSVRLGNGNGSFAATQSYSTGVNYSRIEAGDVNQDGRDDLVALDPAGVFSVFLANGDGSLQAPLNYTSAATHNSLEIFDINNDSRSDVIIGFGAGLLIYQGNGDGSFAAAATFAFASTTTIYRAADLDGNGTADLILHQSGGAGAIATMSGNGDGTFKASVTFGSGYNRATVGDLDGDGDQDLVIGQAASPFNGLVGLNNGDGTFSTGATFLLPGSHLFQDMELADTNNDGVLDLFAATFTDNSVDVLLQDTDVIGGLPPIDLSTAAGALQALEDISTVRTQLSDSRAQIGALLSRLDVAVSLIAATRENLEAASSRLLDADIAFEASQLLRRQILSQVATSILAQANQSPRIALALIES